MTTRRLRGAFLYTFILEISNINSLSNTLYIDKTDVRIGGQKNLSVKMKNYKLAEGFDFKIYLPEGFSFATDADGTPEATLSTERTTTSNTDMFSCALQSDGSLRVLGASTGGHAISGSDGEVVRVKINIEEDVKEGAYPIVLKDIVISDVNASCYEVDSVKSTLDAFSYVLGDANRDNKVNVGDFTSVAHHILERTPASFNIRAADANDNGRVNVADLTAIAHLMLPLHLLSTAGLCLTKHPLHHRRKLLVWMCVCFAPSMPMSGAPSACHLR